jgi:FkbM family methyltransferase
MPAMLEVLTALATTGVKQLSISAGVYRPARWLFRRMHPSQLRAFREDVDLYRELVPSGALCFDVGANIGEKSEALLRAGAGRVVAFEPNPRVLPELRARCGGWKNWTLVEAALGSAPGLATLYARERHGQSGLLKDWEKSRVNETFDVPILTLDAAIQYFGRPFFCKIDVEGWELEVMKGLNQPIPLMSLEFHLIEQDIARTQACLERLERFGPGAVNVTPAETATFHFTEWHRLDRFREWFPGDLKCSLPHDIYGDIFVKRDAS